MHNRRHRIQFPSTDIQNVDQDQVSFQLIEDGTTRTIRLHDYDELYKRPGLYEQVYYDRLKCTSPEVVDGLLQRALETAGESITELRVLDLGAGNGVMGATLKRHGVARIVGADILPEAREAAWRDRPDVYDDYVVFDLTKPSPAQMAALSDWHFTCLTSVAALGFGDVPPLAFLNAMSLVKQGGWLAFNIKETFLDHADQSGFSLFVRELIAREMLAVYHLERYRHRLSMEGRQLFYFALVGRLVAPIPDGFLASIGVA